MNPIPQNLVTGTLGELLVQARFLCYGVQAAPPLKDSGNDLIAIRRRVIKAVQVKSTRSDEAYYDVPEEDKIYDILAAVKLVGEDNEIDFQKSEIYLIPKEEVGKPNRRYDRIAHLKITQHYIDYLFPLPVAELL